MNSINKQKKYLSENLIVESLRMYGSNQEDIKAFSQARLHITMLLTVAFCIKN